MQRDEHGGRKHRDGITNTMRQNTEKTDKRRYVSGETDRITKHREEAGKDWT